MTTSRRPLAAYLRAALHIHLYVKWFLRAAILFRRPLSFLSHYVVGSSPARSTVALRDGRTLYLSSHPHDIITLFVIFAREEYGRFPNRHTVVDIGANIGMFSVWAARQGASKIVAFEPNSAAFEVMRRNLTENVRGTELVIKRLAVSNVAGRVVQFPIAPSAYNAITDGLGADGSEEVVTTSLAEIVTTDAPEGIDLLKLDCEGAEYDLLFAADAPLERVREIRMEYHLGRGRELAQFLATRGFRIDRYVPDGPWIGMLWASRAYPEVAAQNAPVSAIN